MENSSPGPPQGKRRPGVPRDHRFDEGGHWGARIVPLVFLGWLGVLAYWQLHTAQFTGYELFLMGVPGGFILAVIVGVLVAAGRVLVRLFTKGASAVILLLLSLFDRERRGAGR